MDRRAFMLHTAATAVAAVVAPVGADPAVLPDEAYDTVGGKFAVPPWHFRWDQPVTRLTEKEAMGQVTLGTPIFNAQAQDVKDANKRPQILEQRMGVAGADDVFSRNERTHAEPTYYLVGNANVQVFHRTTRVACSPLGKHVPMYDVMGHYGICAKGWKDINDKTDTPESRHVADWICLNIDRILAWEYILEHQDDWFARLILDVRVKNTIHSVEDEAKIMWNAKFRDALTHGHERNWKGM